MSLLIPSLPAGCDPEKAAHFYAEAGWFVLPVRPADKHAGSLVGAGWPQQSSRDPVVIGAWFRRWPNAAVSLHVGRSGGVAFDVDRPANMPDVLRAAIAEVGPPFQSTRSTQPARGHYLFSAAPGQFGNSLGDLGQGWGEVRGLNGIIVVEPTPHEKAAEGGRYAWEQIGPLPAIPGALAACLRPPLGRRPGRLTTRRCSRSWPGSRVTSRAQRFGAASASCRTPTGTTKCCCAHNDSCDSASKVTTGPPRLWRSCRTPSSTRWQETARVATARPPASTPGR